MATDIEKNQHNKDYEYDTLTNERLIKDHDYDGIRELDNDLPPWWKWLFYLTIVFSVVYLVNLFVFKSDNLVQEKEFQKEMAEAELAMPQNAQQAIEFEIVLLEDEASLASGEEIWTKICSVCHLPDGGGLVGPNMTDNFWIHGNTIEEQFNIVTVGVIEKGMIPYKDQLSEQKRLEVISFINLKIVGTTPANPKAPEGTAY